MEPGLEGKRALVTGAGRGIGREIAATLAAQGAAVAVVSRTQSDIDTMLETLSSGPIGHFGMSLDLMLDEAPAALAAAIDRDFGPLDILVHNLGGTYDVTDPFAPIEQYRDVMRLNFDVAVELNRLLLHGMTQAKWGRIVNIASVAAFELNGPPAYAAAKAALCAYTRCVGRLLGGDDVIMSAVLPGIVETEDGYWAEQKRSDPERVQRYLDERCPLGRFGTPKEIADFVAFLCSPSASFNPGAVYPLDGGQLRGYAF